MAQVPVPVPQHTNWSQWTYAQVLKAISEADVDLRALADKAWFRFDAGATNGPIVPAEVGYSAFNTMFFAANIDHGAITAWEQAADELDGLATDLFLGAHGPMNRVSLENLRDRVRDIEAFLARREGEFQTRAANLLGPSGLSGGGADVIQSTLNRFAGRLTYLIEHLRLTPTMTLSVATDNALIALQNTNQNLADAWRTEANGGVRGRIRTAIDAELRAIMAHLTAGGIVMGTPEYVFDLWDPTQNDSLIPTVTQADIEAYNARSRAQVLSVLASYPKGNLQDPATWARINADITAQVTPSIDTMDAIARMYIGPLYDAYMMLNAGLKDIDAPVVLPTPTVAPGTGAPPPGPPVLLLTTNPNGTPPPTDDEGTTGGDDEVFGEGEGTPPPGEGGPEVTTFAAGPGPQPGADDEVGDGGRVDPVTGEFIPDDGADDTVFSADDQTFGADDTAGGDDSATTFSTFSATDAGAADGDGDGGNPQFAFGPIGIGANAGGDANQDQETAGAGNGAGSTGPVVVVPPSGNVNQRADETDDDPDGDGDADPGGTIDPAARVPNPGASDGDANGSPTVPDPEQVVASGGLPGLPTGVRDGLDGGMFPGAPADGGGLAAAAAAGPQRPYGGGGLSNWDGRIGGDGAAGKAGPGLPELTPGRTYGGSGFWPSGQYGPLQSQMAGSAVQVGTGGSMPFLPPLLGGAGGPANERDNRGTRRTWLTEDEEVWGTRSRFGGGIVGRHDPRENSDLDDLVAGSEVPAGPVRARRHDREATDQG